MNEEQPIVISTYKRVWKVPRYLYKIDRFKLLRPVTYWQIFYWLIGIVLVAILNRFFFFNWIPTIGKFGVIPVVLSWYLSKKKHDGKAPHRWLMTYLRYLFSPKTYNRYRPIFLASKEKYGGVATFREVYEVSSEDS